MDSRLRAVRSKLRRRLARITDCSSGRSSPTDYTQTDWERRWGNVENALAFDMGEAAAAVRSAVGDGWFQPGMRVLDIGCGAGHSAAWLAGQGFEVIGIDFARQAIERARVEYGGTPGLSFEVVDVVRQGVYVESFDALIDRGCLHCVKRPDRPAYVANVMAWAQPGGRLLLIMQRRRTSGEELIVEIRELLQPGFEYVSSELDDLAAPHAEFPIPAVAMRFVRTSN